MGRAIDMEKDIDTLKRQMSEVKSKVGELKTTLSEILDAASSKKNVDLVEETKKETKVETKKKKPTMTQVENVVGNLLIDMRNVVESLQVLDVAFSNYVEMKKETEKLREYIENKAKELKDERNTDGAG